MEDKCIYNPVFSIVIPCYNVSKYLSKCLESIVGQTFTGQYEILLIDDCSTDESYSIAQTYKESLPINSNIAFHTSKNDRNLGVAATRNIAIEQAQGRYIIFVDPDDWVSINYLNTAAEIISLQNSIDIIYFSAYYEVHEMQSDKADLKKGAQLFNGVIDKSQIFPLLFDPLIVTCWSYVFKSELLKRFRFNETCLIHEDSLLIPRILLNASSFYMTNVPCYYYLHRTSSLMRGNGLQLLSYVKELNILYQDLKSSKYPIEDKYYFMMFYGSILSRFYSIIFWAKSKEYSVSVFKTWSKDIDLKLIKKSINAGFRKNGIAFIFFKLFPVQFRSLYKTKLGRNSNL